MENARTCRKATGTVYLMEGEYEEKLRMLNEQHEREVRKRMEEYSDKEEQDKTRY